LTSEQRVQLEKMMKNLDLTENEALELMEEDSKINKMTKISEVQSDLTPQQRKASKQARTVAKTTVGKKSQSERVKKVDNEKKELVEMFANLLNEKAEMVEIVNDQKLITFSYNGRKFKLDLIASRK
jgi:hypothetical protein